MDSFPGQFGTGAFGNQFVYSIGWQKHDKHAAFSVMRGALSQLLGAGGGRYLFGGGALYGRKPGVCPCGLIYRYPPLLQCLLTEVILQLGLAGHGHRIAVTEVDSAAPRKRLPILGTRRGRVQIGACVTGVSKQKRELVPCLIPWNVSMVLFIRNHCPAFQIKASPALCLLFEAGIAGSGDAGPP